MIRSNHTYFLWLYNKPKYRHFYHGGSGLFIWLFLALTQPFGIYNTNLGFGGLLLFLLVFAIIWPLISYLADWVFGWSPDKVNKNLFLWFVKIAIMAHAVYGIREFLCSGYCIDLREYGEIWLASGLLFLFTYTPFMLYARYLYFHSLVGLPGKNSKLFPLEGHGRDRLMVSLDDVIYMQADDNYVDIFIQTMNPDNLDSQKEVLRSTLSDLEAQLKDYPEILRIHRSVIINTNYVLKPLKKGSLTIVYNKGQVELPVSKSYQDRVDHLFTHPK